MKSLSRAIIVLAALAGVALALLQQVVAVSHEPLGGGVYVAGEVLVKFKPVSSAQDRIASVAALGHAVVANLHQPGWVRVRIATGQSMGQVLATYHSDTRVAAAQPNYIYRNAAVPNDALYGQLWAFKNTGQIVGATGSNVPMSGAAGNDMGLEPAWDHIADCSSVVVAVIDSGVNYTHQDLGSNMWDGGAGFPNHGHDFVDNDNDPTDQSGHGTHVAGILGAVGNNGTGTTGVCQRTRIMAVRVLDHTGVGTTATTMQGIGFAVTHGARVINMSLVSSGGFDPALSDAITGAQNGDVVVIVAAGNEGRNNDLAGNATFPCAFTQPNLLCVAALDQNYALADVSNWGATSVDVGAPGTNILSTSGVNLNSTSYGTMNGTSMASPEVAGLAAMLRAFNPRYTYADTVGAIKNGGRSVPALAGKTTTGKAVDVMSSLAYINPPTGLTATLQ
ncbi:MAG: S8 family peptidase [Burkholderiales bacterium]